MEYELQLSSRQITKLFHTDDDDFGFLDFDERDGDDREAATGDDLPRRRRGRPRKNPV